MLVKNALRKFWLITLLCLFPFANLEAQESYFPHHLGDMWEYYAFGDVVNDTLQVIVTLDSIGQDGFTYFKHKRQYIDPIQPPPFPWWENFWQDTSANIFASGLGSFKRLMYKLNAPIGQLWIVEDYGGGYDIARVEDVYPDTLFGAPTTIKEIWYYGTEDTSGIIWLWQYTELLAEGFGTVFRGGGDLILYYQLFIKGAVIDGVVYGDTTLVGIKQPASGILPHQFQLFQNYPNPFNPNTTIRFILSRSSRITLIIYDVNGKEVMRLVDNQTLHAGEHEVSWDGKTSEGNVAASGIYFYKLNAGTKSFVRRMLLIR